MRFIFSSLLILLFSLPALALPTDILQYENSMLEYYQFRQSHPLFQRDTLTETLHEGHYQKFIKASVDETNRLLASPAVLLPELAEYLQTSPVSSAAWREVLKSLKSRILEEDASLLPLLESLETTATTQQSTKSGYLSYLESLTGIDPAPLSEEYRGWCRMGFQK